MTMTKARVIILFSLLITAGNCCFVALTDLDSISVNCADEHTEYAYLLATGKEALVFPELDPERDYLSRAVALDLAVIRAGAFTPRSGGGVLLAYPLHALALRVCHSYFAIKLWPILNYTIIYLAWAAFTAAYFPRFTVVVVSLFFLLPPFNLRYTSLYVIGSQNISLLFSSLVVAALTLLKRGKYAGGLGLAGLLAGVGLAACPKNAVDVLALCGLLTVLKFRGVISWRLVALAALLMVVGYLPLPIGYATGGIPPLANFTNHDNLNAVASWHSWAGMVADAKELGEEIRKAFVYQRDLSPEAFAAIDYWYVVLMLVAAGCFARVLARRFSALPAAESAARLYLVLLPAIFLAVYLLGPIRLYDIGRIANFTAYRYYAIFYPPAFIFTGWLLAAVWRRKAGRNLFPAGLILCLFFARPLLGTLCRVWPPTPAPGIFALRPVQFVPLGWLLGKTNPDLPPVEAQHRIIALAEREDDGFIMAREYFRYYLWAHRLSTDEVLDYRRELREPAVRRGFTGALGTYFIESRTPVPADAAALARGKIQNQFDWEILLAAMAPEEQAEFWRGTGYADAAMHDRRERFDRVSKPAAVRAAALRLPPAAGSWYLEGLGEAMVHAQYQYSLQAVQYDYYFATEKAAALVKGHFPAELGSPMLTGIHRARDYFLLQPLRADRTNG